MAIGGEWESVEELEGPRKSRDWVEEDTRRT